MLERLKIEEPPFIPRRSILSQSETLFVKVAACSQSDQPAPRLRRPDRSQLIEIPLDQLIAPDHRARQVWQLVTEKLDCQPLLANIKAVEGQPGRDATDPELLVALWIYAIMDRVYEARHLDRLCSESWPYLWLCGGVTVNYSMLSHFRTAHEPWLTGQIDRVVALMEEEGLCSLEEPMGQDGMRTRAWAGNHSFRSKERLEAALAWEQQQQQFESESEPTPDASQAQQSAQQRAREEKLERLEAACEAVKEVAAAKEARKKGDGAKARASTTDPESRKMKMGDGGYRPGYNVQFATLLGSLVIVGALVSNHGSDAGQLEPMAQQIEAGHGAMPDRVCADGGFSSKENIEAMGSRNVIYCSPIKEEYQQVQQGKDPWEPKRGDTEKMKWWRARMETWEARELYGERCKCELPNAWCRNRGLYQFRVRGLQKVQTVTRWYALAYNLQRYLSLPKEKQQKMAA